MNQDLTTPARLQIRPKECRSLCFWSLSVRVLTCVL